MSDMTDEQIEKEFKRQVYLCSGIGYDQMIAIVRAQFPKQHEWEFYANGSFCKKCGTQIGSGYPCK